MEFTLIIMSLTIFFIACTLALIFIFYGLRYGAMYMRIPTKTLNKVLELVPVQNKTVYDLGAGYGAYTFAAAQKCPATIAIAVEIDPFKVYILKRKSKTFENVLIMQGNIFDVNLSNADIVYCYLFGPLMQQIGLKAQKEMPSGSTLISVEHPIHHLTPVTIDKEHKIYIYKF